MILCVIAGTAHAQRVTVAVNPPFRWADWVEGTAFAGTASLGVTDHNALRANVATYSNIGYLFEEVRDFAESDGRQPEGRITDLGLGWTYYPRALWDGLSLEAGALARFRDKRDVPSTARDSYTIAGRALVGWSWMFSNRVFVAVAAGFSIGRESGTKTFFPEAPQMPVTSHVARLDITGESYVRIGFAIGR